MKKIFFFAAIAALALSSCSSDELVQAEQPVEDGAVVFSAYSGRATRATANAATLKLAKDGFGVFAYEQGSSDWATYVTSYNVPNFMFNQKVQGYKEEECTNVIDPDNDTEVAAWAYKPVKYFSNVENAKHTFFAYGPWKSDINVKFSSTGPKIHYSMDDPYDLLWGHKTSDASAPYTTYTDETKSSIGVSTKLDYTFMHMLAQINVDLSYFSDAVHNGSHGYDGGAESATLEEGTKIIVRSVKLVGSIASEGDLDLATGKWVYTNVDESAFEVSNIIFDHTTDPDSYKNVFDHLQILPPMTGNTVEIQVVYDVETIDEEDLTSLNNHVVTNTWKSGPLTFEQGHAYDYKLHLGMTSVKFNATVNANWDEGTPIIQDLPNANYTSSSNRR